MRLIDADALKEELEEIQPFNWTDSEAEAQEYSDFELFESLINSAPTVDAVSKDLFEQYKWERDLALETLEEHGLSLGQKKE